MFSQNKNSLLFSFALQQLTARPVRVGMGGETPNDIRFYEQTKEAKTGYRQEEKLLLDDKGNVKEISALLKDLQSTDPQRLKINKLSLTLNKALNNDFKEKLKNVSNFKLADAYLTNLPNILTRGINLSRNDKNEYVVVGSSQTLKYGQIVLKVDNTGDLKFLYRDDKNINGTDITTDLFNAGISAADFACQEVQFNNNYTLTKDAINILTAKTAATAKEVAEISSKLTPLQDAATEELKKTNTNIVTLNSALSEFKKNLWTNEGNRAERDQWIQDQVSELAQRSLYLEDSDQTIVFPDKGTESGFKKCYNDFVNGHKYASMEKSHHQISFKDDKGVIKQSSTIEQILPGSNLLSFQRLQQEYVRYLRIKFEDFIKKSNNKDQYAQLDSQFLDKFFAGTFKRFSKNIEDLAKKKTETIMEKTENTLGQPTTVKPTSVPAETTREYVKINDTTYLKEKTTTQTVEDAKGIDKTAKITVPYSEAPQITLNSDDYNNYVQKTIYPIIGKLNKLESVPKNLKLDLFNVNQPETIRQIDWQAVVKFAKGNKAIPESELAQLLFVDMAQSRGENPTKDFHWQEYLKDTSKFKVNETFKTAFGVENLFTKNLNFANKLDADALKEYDRAYIYRYEGGNTYVAGLDNITLTGAHIATGLNYDQIVNNPAITNRQLQVAEVTEVNTKAQLIKKYQGELLKNRKLVEDLIKSFKTQTDVSSNDAEINVLEMIHDPASYKVQLALCPYCENPTVLIDFIGNKTIQSPQYQLKTSTVVNYTQLKVPGNISGGHVDVQYIEQQPGLFSYGFIFGAAHKKDHIYQPKGFESIGRDGKVHKMEDATPSAKTMDRIDEYIGVERLKAGTKLREILSTNMEKINITDNQYAKIKDKTIAELLSTDTIFTDSDKKTNDDFKKVLQKAVELGTNPKQTMAESKFVISKQDYDAMTTDLSVDKRREMAMITTTFNSPEEVMGVVRYLQTHNNLYQFLLARISKSTMSEKQFNEYRKKGVIPDSYTKPYKKFLEEDLGMLKDPIKFSTYFDNVGDQISNKMKIEMEDSSIDFIPKSITKDYPLLYIILNSLPIMIAPLCDAPGVAVIVGGF